MKIVKADAKGRVTGFEPGQTYTVGEQGPRTIVEKEVPKRAGGYLRVDYSTQPAQGTRITLDLTGDVTAIVDAVEEIWKRHKPETVEVVTQGIGYAVSDAMDDRWIKHTRVQG